MDDGNRRAARRLLLCLALAAGRADAAVEPALRCQHAIERAGLRYARGLLAAAAECAAQGSGAIAPCLDAKLGVPPLTRRRARWETSVTRACATTSLGPDLGYFPTCAGGPPACAAAGGGVDCLACRLEHYVRTAASALYANAADADACRAALGGPALEALDALLRHLGACLRRRDAVSIAGCVDEGAGAQLDAALATWRTNALAACGAVDPFTTLGYATLCSGVPPEPINSCTLPAPPCTLPATSQLDGDAPDDDLLDCLGCQVEENALAIARDLFGANLCCTAQGCQLVRSRASCRRLQGTPAYFENRPYTIDTAFQPYGAHGLDVDAGGALYLAGSSVVRVPDPSGSSAPGDVLWLPSVFPTGAAVDGDGNFYIASRCASRIYKVTLLGAVSVVAGTGVPGHSGDGGPATDAQIVGVNRVAVDAAGNLYFTESALVGFYCGQFVGPAEHVRMVDTAGMIHTVAGAGPAGTSGEGGLALAAQLLTPFTLRVDADGSLLVGEYLANRVLRIEPGGNATRIASRYPGAPGGFAGDGGPALRARFHRIEGLRPGAGGELYIGDVENHRVRLIDPLGSVITIAGTGELAPDQDYVPAPLSPLGFPAELAVHPDGRVFFSDTCTDPTRFLRVLARVPF